MKKQVILNCISYIISKFGSSSTSFLKTEHFTFIRKNYVMRISDDTNESRFTRNVNK